MGWVVNAMPRLLYLRERDPVPIVQEAGWAPAPVWTGEENPRTVQHVYPSVRLEQLGSYWTDFH